MKFSATILGLAVLTGLTNAVPAADAAGAAAASLAAATASVKAAAPAAPSSAAIPAAAADACANVQCVARGGAHIIVSRASTEAPGTGIIGAVAQTVQAACPKSDIVANPYPASLDNYVPSEIEGVGNLTQIITKYASCCPKSQMVLMGYSQGAQVTADTLCGASELGFPITLPLDLVYAPLISAVILMGDPSFVKGLPYDVGNASNHSYFPRIDNLACLPIGNRIQSYCDSNDYFCDNGTSIAIHEGYVQEYGAQAANYVIGKIPGCK